MLFGKRVILTAALKCSSKIKLFFTCINNLTFSCRLSTVTKAVEFTETLDEMCPNVGPLAVCGLVLRDIHIFNIYLRNNIKLQLLR